MKSIPRSAASFALSAASRALSSVTPAAVGTLPSATSTVTSASACHSESLRNAPSPRPPALRRTPLPSVNPFSMIQSR